MNGGDEDMSCSGDNDAAVPVPKRTVTRTTPLADAIPQKCPRCGVQNILGYLRHFDATLTDIVYHTVRISPTSTWQIFGRLALTKTYEGQALYLGMWTDGVQCYEVLACGNCWQSFLNS